MNTKHKETEARRLDRPSFTPGPWEYAPKNYNGGGYPEWVRGSIRSADNWYICTIENTDNPTADAHLIAAAPDMYEGLQEAVLELRAVADSLSEGGCGGQGMETTISKYEAILAKARGE